MPISFSLKPAVVEFQLKPGSSFTQAYEITNQGSHPEVLTPSILPWAPGPSSASPLYSPPPTYPGFTFTLLNSDLKFDSPFRLEPGQRAQLVLKVTSAPSALQGDGYFTLFLSSESPESPGASPLSARIGSHLLLSSSPEVIAPAVPVLTKTTLSPKIIDTFFTPVKITGNFFNPSPHFTKIQGKIEILKSGKTLTTLTLAPDNILSQNHRPFRCLNSQNLPIECQLPPPLWPGLYQLKIAGTNQNFYVWPISPATILLLTLGIFIMFLWFRKSASPAH